MKKEEYIKAMDEIKPNEELKIKTLEKIREKREKKHFTSAKFVVSFTLICICILFGIKETQIENKDSIAEEIEIPTLTFEEIYEIAKNHTDDLLRESNTDEVLKTEKEAAYDKQEYSETNVQVKGIDELDLIKQDGEYIYYCINNKIEIIDVKDINNPKKVSEINLEKNEYIRGIYVYKNQLVIIKNEYETKIVSTILEDKEIHKNEVRNYTQIYLYDIQSKEDPVKKREIQIEGNYSSSRMQKGEIYIITNKSVYANMGETDENYYKPTYRDSLGDNEVKYINYDRIYKLQDSKVINYTLIGRINLNEEKETEISTFFGNSNTIYMSENSLYIASVNYQNSENLVTSIYKFSIDKEKMKLIGKGDVEGRILNQFAMDEYNNNLRIVTNQIKEDKIKYINTVFILNENMEVIGKLEGIANGEDLKSVRFDKERAFIVTYKDIDPLFVINLEKPSEIKILGELKIPGYSKYLEVYDETHLLGIGEDTKQTKTGEQRDGMKVTMFDISDVNNPKELSTVKIKDKYAFSEVLYDHKVLLNIRTEGIISFPISYNNYNKQGAIIIKVDENGRMLEKGIITHNEKKNNYESNIRRVLYNNGKIITVSEKYLKVNNVDNLEEVNKIEL